MFDLRIPSGLFFTLIGVILIGYGLMEPQLRAALSDVNVNLYCGCFILAFGVFLLTLAYRGSRKSGANKG
jgi:hypothetical protein